MTSYGPPSGIALRRNGTCTAQETKCNHPWGTWYNCCPSGTHCSSNNTCCPTTAQCDNYILRDVHCANNQTWDLYMTSDDTDGDSYFCCLGGTNGFVETALMVGDRKTTGVGCAEGLPDGETKQALPPLARGSASESTSSAIPSSTPGASNTTSSSASPTPSDSTSSENSSTNTGAIAGGVVGGVAGALLIVGLIWFLMRRRKQQQAVQRESKHAVEAPTKEMVGVYGPGPELGDNAVRAELAANPNAYAHELSSEHR